MIEISMIGLMILISAFFSGVETAVTSMSAMRIVRGDRGHLLKILKNKDDVIAVCLIGNNLAIVGATLTIDRLLPSLIHWYSQAGIFLINIFIFYFLAELLPKAVFARMDVWLLSRLYHPLNFILVILRPIGRFFLWLTEKVSRLIRTQHPVERSDIFYFVSSHVIDKENIEIEDFMRLSETRAVEIMQSAQSLHMLDEEMKVREIESILESTAYTRYPVFKERGDNITGYIHVLDLLMAKPGTELRKIARPAVFIPESLTASELFLKMQSENLSLVFTVNEYGAVSGMITTEDLLEELVGDIQSAGRKETPAILPLKNGQYQLKGLLDIDDFNESFGVSVKKDGFETLAGYLMHLQRKIPVKGEKINAPEGWFTVIEADEKMVILVLFNPAPGKKLAPW